MTLETTSYLNLFRLEKKRKVYPIWDYKAYPFLALPKAYWKKLQNKEETSTYLNRKEGDAEF